MISDWRAKWGGDTDNDFGFYFVQLAPWLSGNINDQQALTRLSQLYALKLSNVGTAVAADLGDPTSAYGSIHPRLKQPVGLRLSLAARAISYGQSVPYLGPMAASWSVVDQRSVIVTFDSGSVGAGLQTIPSSCDPNVPTNQCAEYELATSAGWMPAKGVISGKYTVTVSASTSSGIVGVRYGYANYPIMSLYNKYGLPAVPFMFPNPIKPGSFSNNEINLQQ